MLSIGLSKKSSTKKMLLHSTKQLLYQIKNKIWVILFGGIIYLKK